MNIFNNIFAKILWHILPRQVRNYFSSKLRYPGYIPPGWVDFGDFKRINPIGLHFGRDRGVPIDRYFIEKFLALNSSDIKGRVLEIDDNIYTTKFGGVNVSQSDIMNLRKETNPRTTIVGDITSIPQVASDTFDCIIFTQTLQLIYDYSSAIQTIYRILKPGGFVLATFPGISQIGDKNWRDYWHWNFTTLSAHKIFTEHFKDEKVNVNYYGNVMVATCFLQGLALSELEEEYLEYRDPDYECVITVKAQKA